MKEQQKNKASALEEVKKEKIARIQKELKYASSAEDFFTIPKCRECGDTTLTPYEDPDDVGTQFYKCSKGHITSLPKPDPELQKNREEFFAAIKDPKNKIKLYPHYANFCDNPEYATQPDRLIGFKPARVARWLANNEHFKNDADTDILYYGDEIAGTWTQDGETKLREIVTNILGEFDKKHHFTNILHTLRGLTTTEIQFSQKIACTNGLLDPENGTLTPFTLDEMAFHKIDCEFDPNADCPNFKEFLKQVLNSEDIPTLQEWSGYLLLPDYRFHKLLWLHGQGRNGKGVWQRTMEGILGQQNVSSIGLEELDGNHRFALERLYGKLFNPCSEPTTNRILQTSLLKKATGQDTIEAEIKGKQKRVKFRNTAKITVIANRFPRVKDDTSAFKDRRLFIIFPNEFIGKDCIVNVEKNWLEDPTERKGILSWMTQGLKRLLTNGCFTESKTQEQTEIAFERASDSIGAFLAEMVIFDKNATTTRQHAFESYKEYCEVFGLDAENDKKFTQRLKETPKVTVTTVSNPKRERAWKGITLKTIDNDGKIVTPVTDVTLGIYSNNSKNQNIGESTTCVTSDTAVTSSKSLEIEEISKRFCYGNCDRFREINCTAPNPKTRDMNATIPLKCPGFKPRPHDDLKDYPEIGEAF